MLGESLFSEFVELARASIVFDRSIELRRVIGLEPRTKACQLPRRKLFNGFFDFFSSGHLDNISSTNLTRKW
jgi:hypothetical protein